VKAQGKIIWGIIWTFTALEKHISLNANDFELSFFHEVRAVPQIPLQRLALKNKHNTEACDKNTANLQSLKRES